MQLASLQVITGTRKTSLWENLSIPGRIPLTPTLECLPRRIQPVMERCTLLQMQRTKLMKRRHTPGRKSLSTHQPLLLLVTFVVLKTQLNHCGVPLAPGAVS